MKKLPEHIIKRILFLTLLIAGVPLSYAQERSVSFLFVGDAMQHKSQIEAARTKKGEYDYSAYFKHVKDEVEAADIAVVNLEVTHAGKPYSGYPMFNSPDEFSYALKDAGFDVFLTANNHCLDKKKKGLERTIAVLDSLKVKHTGTFVSAEKKDIYYPLMIIQNGIRIAMLNYTYDTNGMPVQSPNVVNLIDRRQILHDIDLAKMMKADVIVANMHWGDEFKLQANKAQKDLANYLVNNGVRLVIGNHPHVVQPIDIRRNEEGEIDAIVVYSLSNFVSGMKLVNTTGGLMVKINITKDGDSPIKIDSCDYSLVWTHKTEKNNVFNFFELLPVDKFDNEEGKKYMTDKNFSLMQSFAKTAKTTVESLWAK